MNFLLLNVKQSDINKQNATKPANKISHSIQPTMSTSACFTVVVFCGIFGFGFKVWLYFCFWVPIGFVRGVRSFTDVFLASEREYKAYTELKSSIQAVKGQIRPTTGSYGLERSIRFVKWGIRLAEG